MKVNPIFHARTKRIELDFHFVQENILAGTTSAYVGGILTARISYPYMPIQLAKTIIRICRSGIYNIYFLYIYII
jgi:hypothetical protein